MKVTISAPPITVWQALIDPSIISKYFFGVKTKGEWKEGNTIAYEGEWQGNTFRGKGKVLQMEHQRLLKHSYWSDMSGQPDSPEYYHIITYQLRPIEDHTELSLTEENLASEEMQQKSAQLWNMVFENMKKLLEKEAV